MDNSTPDPLSQAVSHTLALMLRGMPTPADRREATLLTLHIAYELLRSTEGNQFMHEWLHAALEDLASDPPKVRLTPALREVH